jgi:hypothetical protein
MTEAMRRVVLAIFIYCGFEGLVVNLFYPNPLAYLPKDFMIAILYVGLLSGTTPSIGSLSRFSGPAVVFALVCFMSVAIPSNITLLGLGVALKQKLFYIPLMYVGYHYMRGDADLARLLRVIAWFAIPVGLFGVYLYFGGPYTLKDIGAEYSHTFFSTSGQAGISFYRVPGTFNSPGQYGSFLMHTGTYLIGFLLVQQLRPRDRYLAVAAMACILPALLVSGSRSPQLLLLVFAGVLALQSRQVGRIGLLAALGYFILVFSFDYFGAGVSDRTGSTFSQENWDRFTGTFFGQLFLPAIMQNPLGRGLGRATIGARHFMEDQVELVESYLGLLATEMGLLGVVSFLVLAVVIGVQLVRSRAWIKNTPAAPIWNAAFLLLMSTLLLTTNSTGLDSIPGNQFFWFFLGVAMKMVDIQRTQWMFDHVSEPGRSAGG